MDRAQFMQQLERLLSDISEAERQEALDYYESYFDDAGEDREPEVIRELGSPGKVAAIIKADLKESNDPYAEYTELGYEDTRTREPGQVPDKYTALVRTGRSRDKNESGDTAGQKQAYGGPAGSGNTRRFGRDRARGRFEQAFSRAGEQMDQALNKAGKQMDQAFNKAGKQMDEAFNRAGEQFDQARSRAGEQFDEAFGQAGEAFGRAGEQFDQARSRAGETFHRAGEQFRQAGSRAGEQFRQAGNHEGAQFDETFNNAGEQFQRTGSRAGERGGRSERRAQRGYHADKSKNRSGIILLLIFLVFASPFIQGAVGGILGVVITILLLPFLLIFAVGAAALGVGTGGVGTILKGIGMCFGNPAGGILTIGVGCFLMAFAIVLAVITVWLACRIIPGLLRRVLDFCQRIFNRGRKEGTDL